MKSDSAPHTVIPRDMQQCCPIEVETTATSSNVGQAYKNTHAALRWWPYLVLTLFIGFHYGSVVFGKGSLNTLQMSPAAAPYSMAAPGGFLAGSAIDRFPKGITTDRAFWDRPMVYDPNFFASHRALLKGEFPWLNSSLALGIPLFANGVDGAFFIGNVVMAFINSYNWDFMYIALFALSGGMIFSVLAHGFRFPAQAALIGSLVYLSSGLFIPQIGYGSEVWNIHIFTWCIFFLARFLRAQTNAGRKLAACALIGSLAQVCYSGMPEGTVAVFCMVGILFVLFTSLHAARKYRDIRLPLSKSAVLLWGATIFAVALLLAAPYLATLLYYSTLMPHSHEVGGLTLPIRLLPGLFLTYLHGWELHHFVGPELAGRVNIVFVGLAPVFSALLLARSRNWSHERTLEAIVFLLIALFYTSQSFSSPELNLNFMGHIPVLNKVFFFRFFSPLFVFSCAYLATLGISRYCVDPTIRIDARVVILGWILTAAIWLLISYESGKVLPGASLDASRAAFISWNRCHILLAGVWSLWLTIDFLLGRRRGLFGPKCRSSAIVILSLLTTNSHFSKSFFQKQDASQAVPYIRFLQENASHGSPFRVYSNELLFPGTASSYGLEDIRHMNPVVPSTFSSFMLALFGDLAVGKVSWERFEKLHEINGGASYSHPGFDLLNVRFLVFPPNSPNIPAGVDFEEVYRDAQAVIVKNRGAHHRIWIAKRYSILGTEGAVIDAVHRDPSRTLEDALLAQEPSWTPIKLDTPDRPPRATISSRTNSSYTIDVSLRENGVLVLADLYQDGFSASALSRNNRYGNLPVFKVDGGLIGIAAPKGQYQINLRYTPPVARAAFTAFFFGLSGFVALMISAVRSYLRIKPPRENPH